MQPQKLTTNGDNSEIGAEKKFPYDTEELQLDFLYLSMALAPSFQDSC